MCKHSITAARSNAAPCWVAAGAADVPGANISGDVVVLDQRIPNWRVVANGQPAVLKRDWHLNVLDIAWEHGFLRELATTGFPAPHRVDAFAGCSWSVLAQARSGPW
jgi:hypothetical protein